MLVDNYEEFLQRLDAAAASLQKRHANLSAVRSVVSEDLRAAREAVRLAEALLERKGDQECR